MNRRRRISHRRKKRNPMAYLFGAGLTLIVLLAALPLLSAEGKPSAETDPVESLEPTWPSETDSAGAGLSGGAAGAAEAQSRDL